MDRKIARLLEADDTDLHAKLLKLAKDYIQLGRKAVDYYATDFDVAHDLFQCYSQLQKDDLLKLEGGHPRRFILPMASTQIYTMATFIAQSLFGAAQPNLVEPRGPEDELKSALMNQLLRWNSDQQPSYMLGYMWVVDCLLYNRGVMYESYQNILKSTVEGKEITDDEEKDEDGNPVKYMQWTRTKKSVGGYNKIHIVSPYDFICDPGLPLYRLQEMRFVGHRSRIPWIDLKARSELSKDNPRYVSAKAVEELKQHRQGGVVGGVSGITNPAAGSSAATLMSRTAYDRSRPTAPLGNDTANKEDGGIIETYEVWIQLVPKDYGLSDNTDLCTWQFLVGNEKVVLSVDESISAHNEFPYSVGEGRPSPHYQYTPSWCLELKPIQDYVDYLKNRRQEALSNTLGNIFIARADKVNIEDFMDPKKEGKIIVVSPEASDTDLNNIIKQVPINDVTQQFNADLARFISMAETTTGATQQMQGNPDDASATSVAGAQQMANGRLASIARSLSVQAIVPQTRRMVSNFQQFFDGEMWLRLRGNLLDLPSVIAGTAGAKITRDTIQGEFDYIAHDGTLPMTDAKKVAAITSMIQAAAPFPFLFDPTQEGTFDLRKLFAEGARAAGVRIENFLNKKPQVDATVAQAAGGLPPAGPGAAAGALPPPGGAPPTPTFQPRATEVGDGLKQPTIGLSPLTPAVRPANV